MTKKQVIHQNQWWESRKKHSKYNLKKIIGSSLIASSLIFYGINNLQRSLNENEKTIKITAVGDVTLAHRFNGYYDKLKKKDGEKIAKAYPFKNVKKYFRDSLTIANFEGTLTENNKKIKKSFNFKGKKEYAEILKRSSIEIANIENNHSGDYGKQGLEDTINALKNEGISICKGDALIKKINGIKVAFLCYNDIKSYFNGKENITSNKEIDKNIVEDFKKYRERADVIVTSFHFGREGKAYPTKRQKELAHKAINLGSNVVLGSHPHTLQGIERYKSGLIFYSLGNFCFGGNDNPEDKDSMIANIEISKYGQIKFNVIPIRISSSQNFNDFQPYAPKGKEYKRILRKIKNRSNLNKLKIE